MSTATVTSENVTVTNAHRLGTYVQREGDKVKKILILDDFGNLRPLEFDDDTFDLHCDFMIDGLKIRDFYHEPKKH